MSQLGLIDRDQPDDTPMDEAVRMVMRFKQMAEDSAIRKKGMTYWEQADRLVAGEHWQITKDEFPDYKDPYVINKIFPIREKLASLMIERLGETEISPRNEGDVTMAENIDNFFLHEFETNNWAGTLAACCKKSIDHGLCFVKVYWDVHGDGGRGTVKLEPVSNYELLLHDGWRILEGKLVTKFAIHVYEKTRAEVLSQYNVDPEGEYQSLMRYDNGTPRYSRSGDNQLSNFDRMNELGVGMTRPSGAEGSDLFSNSPNKEPRKDTYTVYECWYLDDSRVEGPEFDNMGRGGVPPLRYPHGRVITVCNGVKLYDGPNPLGFFPFVPLATTVDIDGGYIPSEINQCAGAQHELNKRANQITDHTELCANPKLIISRFSQIQQDTATNEPGGVWMSYDRENANMGVMWLTPPPLGAEVFASRAQSQQDMEEISGVHEVNRGEAPSNARSGVAIERLQMEGMTRSNMRSLFFDQGIKTLVRNIITLYLDWVTDERQYRFTNPTTMEDEYGVFDPELMVLPKKEMAVEALMEQITELQLQMVHAIDNALPEAEAIQPYIMEEIFRIEREIRAIWELPTSDLVSYDVRISTGTRNLTQSAVASMAIELYQLEVITARTLLKLLDFPGWQSALRLKAEEQLALQAAQEEALDEELDHELEIQDDEQEHELKVQTRDHKHDKQIQKMKMQEATKKAEAQARQQKKSRSKSSK